MNKTQSEIDYDIETVTQRNKATEEEINEMLRWHNAS